MSARVPADGPIRNAYEETRATADEICAEFALDKSTLYKLAKKGKWRRRYPQPFPGRKPAEPAASPGTSMQEGGEGSPLRPGGGASPPRAAGPPDDATGPAPAPDLAPARRRLPPPNSPAARRRIIDRLVAAISLKLEQLERRMTHDLASLDRGVEPTATDHERETRAIGALIDNLGKITEIEGGNARTANGRTDRAAADLAGEADRIRRELAERLRKIVDAAALRP